MIEPDNSRLEITVKKVSIFVTQEGEIDGFCSFDKLTPFLSPRSAMTRDLIFDKIISSTTTNKRRSRESEKNTPKIHCSK